MSLSPSTKRKNGQVIHSDGRNIIANIINICELEKANNEPLEDLNKPLERAALYSGTSLSTVKRIKREYVTSLTNELEKASNQSLEDPLDHVAIYSGKSLSTTAKRIKREYVKNIRINADEEIPVKLPTPGKKMNRANRFKCGEFYQQAIRQIISNYYLEDVPRVPSTPKLRGVLQKTIGFPYSRERLRLLLKSMGYSWRKCGTKRKFLVERPENAFLRKNYIEQIRMYRNEGAKICYIGETCIDNNMTFKKCWEGVGFEGIIVNSSPKNQLILVHACTEDDGFLQWTKLLYRAKDYHGQINWELFLKWVTNQLIPSLPANSVIVMDNARYHSKLIDKVPNKYSIKSVMKEWLLKKNIPVTDDMMKHELYSLIELNKPKEKIYVIDEVLKQAGHRVLRLPPYMCELNMIELAWAEIKKKVIEASANGELSGEQLQEATDSAIGATNMKGFLERIVKAEDYYLEMDPIMENRVDEVIENFGNTSDNEDNIVLSEGDENDSESGPDAS